MDALEALRTRRSIRAFLDKPVDKELVQAAVDCGRLAASACNEQPWEFVAVTDATMRRKIADTTDHGKFIADAPVCIAVFCKNAKYYLEDGSAATQNILVAVRACGLGACWVAGDKKPYVESIRKLLGVPDTHRLVSLVAVGHPASVPSPTKRALEDVLHWERF